MASASFSGYGSPGSMERKVDRIFTIFDKDGDGRISREDLSETLHSIRSNILPEEVDCMMSDIDTNGDGFIDTAEFMASYWGGGSGCEFQDAFKLYDVDRNGLICARELHFVMRSLGDKRTINYCSEMIRRVDRDRDGFINFEEFERMMTPKFLKYK